MNENEAEKLAEELIKLELQNKEIKERIKRIKGELLDFTDVEEIADKTWSADNGYVEITTVTKRKLVDIPNDFKVPTNVVAIDVAQKAFKSKIVLSKEGKKMVKEEYEPVFTLTIPSVKKQIKVVI